MNRTSIGSVCAVTLLLVACQSDRGGRARGAHAAPAGEPARVDEHGQTSSAPTPQPAAPVASTPDAASQKAKPTSSGRGKSSKSQAPPWGKAAAHTSNAGTYVIRVAPDPAGIPQGDVFELEVWVCEARTPERLADDVELAVDADMPEHGHGLPRLPSVERIGPGHFRARGLRLHMPGLWELYFDIGRGALTERAQITLTLE